jgi:hypothetical protein
MRYVEHRVKWSVSTAAVLGLSCAALSGDGGGRRTLRGMM